MITIKERRIAKGMTIADLARALGLTPAAITFWEQGVTRPSVDNLLKLARLFGCTVDELLGGGEDQQERSDNNARNQTEPEAV